ncbi:MAG: DUF4062 domain-containing protein [Bacteroidales bacterium]|nr:DUF4062 domain-containing protein [Bacteroidales bacterium]
MKKLKVFISSVQSEFAGERQMLFRYLMQDALLGLFFEPFIFENVPASEHIPSRTYLDKVAKCDIYIGLFGKEYGNEDENGVSPTEHEFNQATHSNKTRLIFLSNHENTDRHSKEVALVKRAEQEVVRKMFSGETELKTAVYSSLVRYLEEKEYIRTGPFDASVCVTAGFSDIDPDKVVRFTTIAKAKRGFPLHPESPINDILTHLNLLNSDRISNAALLLFGKKPQNFFISSEIKCAQFHGIEIVKPIPSYQVYKGDVFQLVDQAVDFVLSRINVKIGTREKGVDVPVEYEIPQAVVAEAIVNAIAHRDYTSHGSVQVMLFKDRLEIWNPGQLPPNLTLLNLRTPHGSFPANPLLAEPMYLTGYIERLGTGTRDMIRLCNEKGLKEPDFKQEDVFKAIIWRNVEVTEEATGQVTGEPTGEVKEEIKRVILVIDGEVKRSEIQDALELKHQEYFRDNYLIPSINSGFVEMTYPDTPNHPKQRYRLTAKGNEIKKLIGKR